MENKRQPMVIKVRSENIFLIRGKIITKSDKPYPVQLSILTIVENSFYFRNKPPQQIYFHQCSCIKLIKPLGKRNKYAIIPQQFSNGESQRFLKHLHMGVESVYYIKCFVPFPNAILHSISRHFHSLKHTLPEDVDGHTQFICVANSLK